MYSRCSSLLYFLGETVEYRGSYQDERKGYGPADAVELWVAEVTCHGSKVVAVEISDGQSKQVNFQVDVSQPPHGLGEHQASHEAFAAIEQQNFI